MQEWVSMIAERGRGKKGATRSTSDSKRKHDNGHEQIIWWNTRWSIRGPNGSKWAQSIECKIPTPTCCSKALLWIWSNYPSLMGVDVSMLRGMAIDCMSSEEITLDRQKIKPIIWESTTKIDYLTSIRHKNVLTIFCIHVSYQYDEKKI